MTGLALLFLLLIVVSAWRAHRRGPAGIAGLDRASSRWYGFRLRRGDGPGTF